MNITIVKRLTQCYALLVLAGFLLFISQGAAQAQIKGEEHGFTVDTSNGELLKTLINTIANNPKMATASDFAKSSGNDTMPAVNLQLIFLGPAWNNQNIQPVVSEINSILQSPYLSEMSQYGFGPPVISASIGGVVIDSNMPSNPCTINGDLWPADIGAINSGFVAPLGTPNTLYFVIPQPGITYGGAANIPGIGFIAQEGTGAHMGFILSPDTELEIILDVFTLGTAAPEVDIINARNAFTMSDSNFLTVFSHEVVESISDPDGTGSPGWQMDRNFGGFGENEIADAFDSAEATFLDGGARGTTGNTWTGLPVTYYWSQTTHKGVAPEGDAAQLTNDGLTSYFDGSFIHAVYIDPSQHLNELFWNPSTGVWNRTDMTAQAGGPPALATTALTSFYNPVTHAANVSYIAQDTNDDNEVHTIFKIDGQQWVDVPLGAAIGAPGAWSDAQGSRPLASLYDPVHNQQDIFYVDAKSSNLDELLFSNGTWTLVPDINGGSSLNPDKETPLCAVMDPVDNEPHVFYVTTGGSIYEAIFVPGHGWDGHIWTSSTFAIDNDPIAPQRQAVTAYFDSGGVTHVFYLGADGFIHHEWRIGTATGHETLPANLLDTSQSDIGSLTSYYDGSDGHVFFYSPDEYSFNSGINHVTELVQTAENAGSFTEQGQPIYFYNDTWNVDDPSELTDQASMIDCSALTSCFGGGVGIVFGIKNDPPPSTLIDAGDVDAYFKLPSTNWFVEGNGPSMEARAFQDASTPFAVP